MTIQNLTQKSNKMLNATSTTPSLDTVVFLCEVLDQTKEFIFANPNFEVSNEQEKKFWGMIERRKKNEPVAYIINKKEFFGLDFFINKNVLIPRPETEMLVEEIIHNLNCELNCDHSIDVIDVGTGSGCIISSIAKYLVSNNLYCSENILPSIEQVKSQKLKVKRTTKYNFFAIDSSAESLEVAKKNFKTHGVNFIQTLQGNLLKPYLKIKNTDNTVVIIANLPYLNDEEYENTSPDVKNFEPKSALYGGVDGLKYIKELLEQIAKNGLNKTKIVMEISPSQVAFLQNNGFEIKKDLFGVSRYAIFIT